MMLCIRTNCYGQAKEFGAMCANCMAGIPLGTQSPFDVQEGGDHYKDFPIQPALFCQKNRIPWCEANIIYYACRHKSKNGREDLQKIKHYVNMLIEMEYPE